MTQNYPKWPKNDTRIYALFSQFFLTAKAVPQTFSLLECMTGFRSGNSRSCLGKWIQQDFYHKMESGAFCYRLAPTSRAGEFAGSGNTLGEDDGDGNDDDEDGNDDRDAVGISLFLAFG